jgi:hypothetical protein
LVPNVFPLCSLQFLNRFSSGSQYVHRFPTCSPSCPHLVWHLI